MNDSGGGTRVWVDGVEINKLKPLPEIIKSGKIITPPELLEWIDKKYPDKSLEVVMDRPHAEGRFDDEAEVIEVWVGGIPKWREKTINKDCVAVLRRHFHPEDN